jgi:hypothetical protein
VQRLELLIWADKRITKGSVATALGCSRGSTYSTLHDLLKFWKVCTSRLLREVKDREKMNRMGLSLQHLLRYADEENMLNRIVTGKNHGCITTNPNESFQQYNGNIPLYFQPKNLSLCLHHQLDILCLPCFGILGGYCWPIFRSVVKIWILYRPIKLCWSFGMQFTENVQANLQEKYCLSWQCLTPYSPRNSGDNSRTTVGTSCTCALEPGLGP